MERSKFEHEMSRANALLDSDPDYWTGYMRGLRRAYYDEKFGTEEEHQAWSNDDDHGDTTRRARLDGYKDGLKGESKNA